MKWSNVWWMKGCSLCWIGCSRGYGRLAANAPQRESKRKEKNSPEFNQTKQLNNKWSQLTQLEWNWWNDRKGRPANHELSDVDWAWNQPQGGKSILFFNFCWPAARHQKVEWKEMVGLPSSLFRQRKDFSFGERSRAGKRNKQTQFHFLHSFKRMEWNEFGFFSINQLNAAQPIIKSILIWLRNEKDFIFWMEQSN